MRISFFVPGVAAPQGSKVALGGGRMRESSAALHGWRTRIGYAANRARSGSDLFVGAVRCRLVFVMPRPKGLAQTANPPCVKRPDLDKLVRAVFDALTGTMWLDDSLVTELLASKRIAAPAEQPGVEITVELL
jgi:crossover junction endodeoxyribonuclease RusA